MHGHTGRPERMRTYPSKLAGGPKNNEKRKKMNKLKIKIKFCIYVLILNKQCNI